jgi:hypothetical protein
VHLLSVGLGVSCGGGVMPAAPPHGGAPSLFSSSIMLDWSWIYFRFVTYSFAPVFLILLQDLVF